MILFNFLRYLFIHIKYTKLLKTIYKDEKLLEKFSQLFGVEFRIDWVGRVYAVLNPNIIDDQLDVNTQIFEYTEHGLSNKVYLERWIMLKFNLIKDFKGNKVVRDGNLIRFFYNFNEIDKLLMDIKAERKSKLERYGNIKYKQLLEKEAKNDLFNRFEKIA